MVGRLNEIVIDCADPPRLARFWTSVVGGEAAQPDEDPPDTP
ncbi:VOC family protein [Actinoallomurus acanthiterrae]